MTDKDLEKLRDCAAKVGEFFPDFLLLVRVNDGYAWKVSDETWGIGAAERFSASIRDNALIRRIEAMEEGE